jgi:5'-nucleotidase
MSRHAFRLLGAVLSVALLAACANTESADEAPLQLKILHINDHHSRLDAETVNLQVATASGQKESVTFELGGFPRVTAAIQGIAGSNPNVLKLHAGDAITGDLYYTITNGKADADLMNSVCFDAFALGNHEFDSGDAGLKTFLDFLKAPGSAACNTAVLSANARPQLGVSPLTRNSATDYFRPAVVVERSGARIGIVGITVAAKTRFSSRPDPGTLFDDEVTAAQREIDSLRSQGVKRIVLLTHQGYEQDVAMASRLDGADVIVGGDSHTLVGPTTLSGYGLTPAGRYPTMAKDSAGRSVCVVQAWQYSWVVGELDVEFDRNGDVTACGGAPRLLIGAALRRSASGAAALSDADRAAIQADGAREPALRVTTPSAGAVTTLAAYKAQKDAFGATKVGAAAENLCLRRVPGTKRDVTRSALGDACNRNAFTNAHGGDAQQLVAYAYLDQGRRFGGADIALQNAGGVRIDIRQGDITVGTVYTLLPFRNVLARLTMTGAEIKATLEDAIAFVLAAPGNTGAYPYGANIRWKVDLNQPAGSRFSGIEVKGADGAWAPIGPATSYKVMVNDFLVAGGDGWNTLKTITGSRREDTLFLDYADSFVNYVKATGTVARLPAADYSTQVFVDTP